MAFIGRKTFATIVMVLGAYFIREYCKPVMCKSPARLDGKVIIVTGSNTGIGKYTVQDFINRGGKVYMACRSVDRANAAAQDILRETGAWKDRLVVMKLDLSSLESVREFAKEFKKAESSLHVLVNNAGVWALPDRTLSAEGYEMQFATNHLGHFLLTHLLLDLLASSSPSRVVTVSSEGHRWTGIHFSDINLEHSYGPFLAYGQSKLANVMFSQELGKRLQGTGVTTYSLHPGIIYTDIARNQALINRWAMRLLGSILPFTKTIPEGAQTTVCCAVDEALAGETGHYYSDCAVYGTSWDAQVEEDCTRLWDLSVEMVNLTADEMPEVLKKQ